MSKKRKLSTSTYTSDMYDDTAPLSDRQPADIPGKVDPTYGQRSALPCAGDDAESLEAMEYLRSVRSEASSIPNLLVAPSNEKDSERKDPYADYPTAFYHKDGAYIARSIDPPRPSSLHSDDSLDPQESYYAALLLRFRSLQRSLQSPPESSPDPRAKVLLFRKASAWRSRLLTLEPTMRLLASLDQDTVIYGLNILSDVITRSNLLDARRGKCLGAWAWGLLARCREVGMMDSERVGVVRLLGKQAGFILRREGVEGGSWGNEVDEVAETKNHLSDEQATNEEAIDEDTEVDGREDAVEELEKRRKKLLEMIGENDNETVQAGEPDHEPKLTGNGVDQTLVHGMESMREVTVAAETPRVEIVATLDAILTIVGDVYGQRDLLDCRLLWEEM